MAGQDWNLPAFCSRAKHFCPCKFVQSHHNKSHPPYSLAIPIPRATWCNPAMVWETCWISNILHSSPNAVNIKTVLKFGFVTSLQQHPLATNPVILELGKCQDQPSKGHHSNPKICPRAKKTFHTVKISIKVPIFPWNSNIFHEETLARFVIWNVTWQ